MHLRGRQVCAAVIGNNETLFVLDNLPTTDLTPCVTVLPNPTDRQISNDECLKQRNEAISQ
ncbi:hypothetical protein RvY_16155 [Ramazzottius varieornatus]|uniref:Uncharacterized protein n=1 Tax=Ramazzottius varieornatus TaxID=947166 RepID=A0A1D1W3Z5_RAMVA|nr:hypothetical protein RvY_16155 [Ramazzottius varieornatus]